MQNSTLANTYKKAKKILWVTPIEANGCVLRLHYSREIANELSEWIARRLSMAFLAGCKGNVEPPIVVPNDLIRMLIKMGYAEERAIELSSIITNNVMGVFRKGASWHQDAVVY